MAGFFSWIQANWASVIGAVGIIGSLWFTAAYFRQDTKARQMSNLLTMAERHRVLWNEVQKRPELARILEEDADFSSTPTIAEQEFLNLIIAHFETGWRIAKATDGGELKVLAQDAGEFFRLPVPHAIWEKTKGSRNPKFVRFVEKALKRQQV